jgi:hypothetical protein
VTSGRVMVSGLAICEALLDRDVRAPESSSMSWASLSCLLRCFDSVVSLTFISDASLVAAVALVRLSLAKVVTFERNDHSHSVTVLV